jgi:ABC-2 type transport system ATP-binding protein
MSNTPPNDPAPRPNDPAVKILGLTKRFGRSAAVHNLSLSIPRGCAFGLLGPNGAGKSTTLRMLMGTLAPTAGEARVLGIDVCHNPTLVKQKVGYVPETHHIYRWMRVGEVIGFCRSCYPTWNEATCREMCDRFALDPRKKVKHLSKGTLVKLALVLAVSHEPELLLLDEPLSGLDPIAREEFLDGVLQSICDRGHTVVISSHIMDDVRRLADRMAILYEGQILVEGNVDQLLATTKRVSITLHDGSRPEKPPEGTVWQRVQGREWLATIRDFSPEKEQFLRSLACAEHVEVHDLDLEELFKDYVKGQKVAV